MLNYYYWYSIIASVIFGLYILPFSGLNSNLNGFFLILIILSIILSIILGTIFKKSFVFMPAKPINKKSFYIPMIIILILYIIEIIYLKEIPFISVTIKHIDKYQEYQSIPFFHMLLAMLCMYYSTKYIYHAISYKENRKKNILCYFIINILMISYNMRSFFMISLFLAINLLISSLRSNGHKFLNKKTILTGIVVIISLFMFGGVGNMRQGFTFNNSSYIEQIGRYNNWPKIVPKQYMWSYSYITSPLANLNYNIINNNYQNNIEGFIYQLIPDSITKRIGNPDKIKECSLITQVFTTSTGYCRPYSNLGFIGIILFWIVTMLFPIFVFKYRLNKDKQESYIIFISLYCTCISFLFFTNMFSYGGTSPALWLSFILLINKIKISYKRKENV